MHALTAVASGLPAVGHMSWGSHVSHFYRTPEELLDVLVPYFAAGLSGGDECLWITSDPVRAAEARAALARHVPDLGVRERAGQIEIIDERDWYLRVEGLEPDALVAMWLARESAAIARGRAGLRISGNTSWVPQEDWHRFCAYEGCVHRAFYGRRIVAVCSYWIDRCGADDAIDVLRNHKLALVRRGETWEAIQSATALLGALERPANDPVRSHVVRFYETGEYPAEAIAAFLAPALRDGRAAVSWTTPQHHAEILAQLEEQGVDTEATLRERRLAWRDAGEVVREILRDGQLDVQRLDALVGASLAGVRAGGGELPVYGEVVDLLCSQDRHDLAVAVERRWNELLRDQDVALFCAYDLARFDGRSGNFHDVCATHAHVHASPAGSRSVGRLSAELQHATRALRLEVEQRRLADAAARSRARHLEKIQSMASLLAEAASPSDVATLVAQGIPRIVGARRCLLAFARDGVLVGLEGESHGLGPRVAAAFGAGRVSREIVDEQLVVAMPLFAASERIGAIGLTLDTAHVLAPGDRALLDDVGRQVALALDRARIHEAAQRTEQALREANRRKDEFLAMLGHELRNPLAPIMTALQLMKLRGDSGAERERALIERQVRHVSRLVDDLLDVSRISRGKLDLKTEHVELAPVVARAIEVAGPLIEQRGHRLSVEVPTEGLLIECDRGRMAQAIGNLLTNAAKYTDPGGAIAIRAWCDEDTVLIAVRDNGIGLGPETLQMVFEPFTQVKRTVERAQGGIGLGLWLVRNLVEIHGGTVNAESEGPGRGSEFTIRIPRSTAGASIRARRQSSGIRRVARVWRVLVVDDNPDAADSLAELLRAVGHEVDVAYDAPEALECANARVHDVAILDLGLPIMDGYELCGKLREGARPPRRFFAVTGYGTDEDRARTRAAGFDAHFVKPFDVEALLATLHEEPLPEGTEDDDPPAPA